MAESPSMRRLSFATKSAFVLSLVSLVGLLALSVVFKGSNAVIIERRLDDNASGYSGYSCHHIYDVTPDAGDEQCQFARECNDGDGVWAPIAFCSRLSTKIWVVILSPVIILWLVLLFRMLGSTAEDYFSPSLEMFSVRMGLPPRFAGVTLLALGNGAGDVSATVSAITGDAQNGYKLSLGALTGAAMFIGSVVSGLLIIVADGVPCRGALVRDVAALLIAVLVTWRRLASGTVGPEAISLFLSTYAIYVVVVLVADIYHRAVVLPRLAATATDVERERQLAEEASHRQATAGSPLSNVITALSNYDRDNTVDGWGVESDDLAADRPVLLHGHRGILHEPHASGPSAAPESNNASGYSMLEDAVDNPCVEPGSFAASNWSGAFYDGKNELMAHANSLWDDIAWNGDLHVVDKFLLICEVPFTALRKLTVPIPCEGYYVRALVALSMVVSPLWFAYYLYRSQGVYVGDFWVAYLIVWALLGMSALLVLRLAPGGEGSMTMVAAVPIALYGFIIAATWIDTIADALVSLLNFIGIILSIPSPVLGLTLLAWGNSMSDLSANMTLARKGLANMAMTACFAGPLFNILVGLGLGFSSLAAKTGVPEREVSLSPSVLTGFLFIALNTSAILSAGLVFGKGRIPKHYGYISLALYAVYVVSSISLQFSKYGDNE